MPRPRKVEKKVKPKEETTIATEGPIELKADDILGGELTIKEDPNVEPVKIDEPTIPYQPPPDDLPLKPSKREQIDELLANHCTFYPDPTRLQYGTEMWPWLKQLSELLE